MQVYFVFICLLLFFGWCIDHALIECPFRGYVSYISVCKRDARGEKQSNVFFGLSKAGFCAVAQGRGADVSTVSLPCLPFRAGGRASMWFSRQSGGHVRAISSIIISNDNNNNHNNSCLQHPGSSVQGVLLLARLIWERYVSQALVGQIILSI